MAGRPNVREPASRSQLWDRHLQLLLPANVGYPTLTDTVAAVVPTSVRCRYLLAGVKRFWLAVKTWPALIAMLDP